MTTSNDTVAIIPGRFQPFTPVHASMYWQAKSLFDDVIIGVKDYPILDVNNPFTLEERLEIVDTVIGDPSLLVRVVEQSPYNIDEYTHEGDVYDTDKVVFIVGSKDKDRFRPSNCGTEGKFLQYFTSTDEINTCNQNAYVYFTDTMNKSGFMSATQIRNVYRVVDNKSKFIERLYNTTGNKTTQLVKLFNRRLL